MATYRRASSKDWVVQTSFEKGGSFSPGNNPFVIIDGVIWGAGESDTTPGSSGHKNLKGYNTSDGSLAGTISVTRNISGYALAVDQNNYIWARHGFGFVSGQPAFIIVNPATQTQVTTFGNSASPNWGNNKFVFDPTNNLMWIQKTTSSVTAVSTTSYTEIRTISTTCSAIGFDTDLSQLWVKIPSSTDLKIYNPATGALIATLASTNTGGSSGVLNYIPSKKWMILAVNTEVVEIWNTETNTKVYTTWIEDSVSDFFGVYYSPATNEIFGYDILWDDGSSTFRYISVDGTSTRDETYDLKPTVESTAYAAVDPFEGSLYIAAYISTTSPATYWLFKIGYETYVPLDTVLELPNQAEYENNSNSSSNSELENYDVFNRELILDLTLGAFYIYDMSHDSTLDLPYIRDYISLPTYTKSTSSATLYSGNDVLTDGSGNALTVDRITLNNRTTDEREEHFKFLVTDGTSITIADYHDYNFVDWRSSDGTGVDFNTYLLTGYELMGDMLSQKQSIYLKMYFERTEESYTLNSSGSVVLTRQSGCHVQSQWNWNNSYEQGKWGVPFQAYRLLKTQPTSPSSGDAFNYAERVIVTKNKLRGRGHCLSLYIVPDAGKDCKLLGWGLEVTSNGRA